MTPLDEGDRDSRLRHIRTACEAIMRTTKGRTFSDYVTDELLHGSVERQLSIVGEAVSRLARLDRDVAAKISDVPRIIGLRNKIIHDYPNINDSDIWKIVNEDVPRLLTEVDRLLPVSGGGSA